MKINLAIFLSFITFWGYSQNKKNDLQTDKLQGKVKSVSHQIFNAIEKDGEIEISEAKSYNEYTLYKKWGNKIESILTDTKGDLYQTHKFFYDETGNLKENIGYTLRGKLFVKSIYSYKENFIIQTLNNDSGDFVGQYISKYEKGNLIESISNNSNGSVKYKTINKFDKKGKLIESNNFDGNVLYKKCIFKNNQKENIIHKTCYSSTGIVISDEFIKYDYRGNELEWWSSELNSNKFKYEYKLDSKNNWIEKLVFKDGKPYEFYKRKIEYYK